MLTADINTSLFLSSFLLPVMHRDIKYFSICFQVVIYKCNRYKMQSEVLYFTFLQSFLLVIFIVAFFNKSKTWKALLKFCNVFVSPKRIVQKPLEFLLFKALMHYSNMIYRTSKLSQTSLLNLYFTWKDLMLTHVSGFMTQISKTNIFFIY